jgi:CDP-L-myo-inositol myo-inositolphosphotransferase
VPVGGVALLKRTILALRREGVRRFVVVFADHAVPSAFARDRQLSGIDIEWIANLERPSEDGWSLRCARPHVRGDFFLLSCDRVFSPEIVRTLLTEPLDGATLAFAGGQPVGIATAGRDLLDAVEVVRTAGDTLELERAYGVLAARGALRKADVGDAWFHAVTGDVSRRAAERMLVASLRKSVDGVIARHINRRFSLAMTQILMHFPVRPNHVTAASLLVSIAAAVLAAMATVANPWWLVVGAALWQLASMMDGIDGELARLKFGESRFGEWFDTLTDDVGKFTFFIGSGIGATAVSGDPIWLQVCAIAVTIQMTLAVNLYRKLLKTGSGSHYALAWETKPKDTWTSRFYNRIEFMSRRDYYVFAWLCLCAAGYVGMAIAIMFATTLVVLAHELLRPRQVRDDFPVQPPVG